MFWVRVRVRVVARLGRTDGRDFNGENKCMHETRKGRSECNRLHREIQSKGKNQNQDQVTLTLADSPQPLNPLKPLKQRTGKGKTKNSQRAGRRRTFHLLRRTHWLLMHL